MKALIVVLSYHHGNTAKIADVIAQALDARVKTPQTSHRIGATGI